MNRNLLLFIIFCLSFNHVFAQDLDSLLEVELNNKSDIQYTEATFKGTRVIIGQSIENKARGELNFLISHHFGAFNLGAYNFFGLDYSQIRLGFEYGLTNNISIGIGRSSYNKLFDGNFKFKLFRQSTGARNFPLSISFYSNIALNSLHWSVPDRQNKFDSRFSYAFEFLIARKMGPLLSLQVTPVLIHRNLVKTEADQNDVPAIGVGGRLKFSKRSSLNAEYYYLLPGKTADEMYNSLSVGIDIETGGHVFQIFLTNSNGMIEQAFVAQTSGNWLDGDIMLGFNISRTFTLIKKNNVKNDNY
jgi:hypothetical protein